MSLKIEFVERAQKGEKIAPLCREFGISRTAGHKWLKRYRELGYAGLDEVSRRPKSAPLATAEDIVLAVLQARDAHPRWGPHKLRVLLVRSFGDKTPSERTIARILRRANKVRRRRRRSPVNIVESAPRVTAASCNDVWTVDFKGYWRTLDGSRCDTLTVRDAFSRFVLACEICESTSLAVRLVFARLFARYGVPNAIQSDNGVPFVAVRSRGGVSTLSAWWISLGIKIVRSRPGCPQDNGAHERMHADIAAEVERYPEETPVAQQRALARWKQQFNHVRPHDALDGKTPAEVYVVPERRRPRIHRFRYPDTFTVRRVSATGTVRLDSEPHFISSALAGYDVGLETVDALHLRVWLRDVDLGLLEYVTLNAVADLESRQRRLARGKRTAA